MAQIRHACPYLGILFGPIGLKFIKVTQETIIYRLVKRNPSYHAHFYIQLIWAGFGGKMGVVTTQTPTDLRLQNPNKKLANWVDLHLNKIFRSEPPFTCTMYDVCFRVYGGNVNTVGRSDLPIWCNTYPANSSIFAAS